jgi:hypothetical protein
MSTHTRGHSLPLRLTIPPLRTLQGFACSVASLSRCPYHYPPGHHSLRRAALVECPLGQGKPSTWPEGHGMGTDTSLTSFHLDDRRAQPPPAGSVWCSIFVECLWQTLFTQCAPHSTAPAVDNHVSYFISLFTYFQKLNYP